MRKTNARLFNDAQNIIPDFFNNDNVKMKPVFFLLNFEVSGNEHNESAEQPFT
jgi:hypothetical protein